MLYCSKCKKHSNEACSKKRVMITNIKIKRASRCSECLAVESFVDKAKTKNVLEISA